MKHYCFRCDGDAVDQYMGIWYCEMCLAVVPRVLASVRHDPPVGFPGGVPGNPDYYERAREERMKEKSGEAEGHL